MANDTAKKLLERVRELRESRGLSQEAFAERAGMTYKYYQQLETGRKMDFHFATFLKLAKACGLEPWELLHPDTELAVGEGANEKPDYSAAKRRRGAK